MLVFVDIFISAKLYKAQLCVKPNFMLPEKTKY